MKIGVGLLATIPNVSGKLNLEWAREADERGFSSTTVIDRMVYANYEPITTLAAVAAITKRIRLMTTILVLPLREPVYAAKQIATLDCISDGRLTLGLGIGSRPDDINSTEEANFEKRGGQLGRSIRLMKKIWSGERLNESVGPIGPSPVQKGGPPLLIGGTNPNAISRVGKYGDGYITGGGLDATTASSNFKIAEQSWKTNNRTGKPKFVCCQYFALGEGAYDRGSPYLLDYYASAGPFAKKLASAMLSSGDKINQAVESFSSAGVHELIFWPCIPDMKQLDLLDQALSSYSKT